MSRIGNFWTKRAFSTTAFADPSVNPIGVSQSPITESVKNPRNEIAMICNELDCKGALHVTSGRFLKTTLCQQHGLQPRDLRKLDGTLRSSSNTLPAILIRSSALLINLDYIKAIINHNAVTFFESTDLHERSKQHEFLVELQQKLQSMDTSLKQPFEFAVLEAMLQRLLTALQEEFEEMAPKIEAHLSRLERHIHWDKLKVLLECKKRTALFLERVHNLRDCLKELLESDIDMANMYLSHKARQKARPVAAHEEVELLLESYLKQAEELASRAELLSVDIQATEDIVNIGLVSQRNELLLLELKLGIGTFAAAMGGLVASVLGMNVVNHLEGLSFAFAYVLAGISFISSVSFGLAWRKMLRLLKC